MENYKYVGAISNKQGKKVVDMHLYDNIGFGGIKSADFVNEMKAQNADRINVRINTKGGDVIEGLGILSAMLNFQKEGGELHTYNDGVAASTGGWLLVAAKPENIHSKDYAILMLHGVSNDTQDGLFRKTIEKIFKNRAGLNVSELMTNGKDNFFNAEEAAERGFLPFGNIENTGLELPKSNDLLLVANAAKEIISNNLNINIKKPLSMKRIANLLNLQEGSTEEVIANAISNTLADAKKSADKLEEVQNTLKEKETELEKLNKQIKAANRLVAVGVVENAIKEGRLSPKDEDAKKSLIEQADANLEGFKNMIEMIPVKAANIIDQTKAGQETPENLLEQVKNRGFRTLEKEDPSLLAEIKNSAKGEYVKLYNKQYDTNKTEADFA